MKLGILPLTFLHTIISIIIEPLGKYDFLFVHLFFGRANSKSHFNSMRNTRISLPDHN